MPNQDTLTPREAAEGLGITRRTVYRWIRSGKLQTSKADGKHHINAEQLAAATTWERAIRAFQAHDKTPDAPDMAWIPIKVGEMTRKLDRQMAEVSFTLSASMRSALASIPTIPSDLLQRFHRLFPWPRWTTKRARYATLYACWVVLENPHGEQVVKQIHKACPPAEMTQKDMFEAAAVLLGDTRVAVDRRLRRAIKRGMVHIEHADGTRERVRIWPGPDVDDWHRFLEAWLRRRSRSY